MRVKRILLTLMMLAYLATLFSFASIDAKASDKGRVLRACAQLFGKPVDEKRNLFEVNRFYVLRVSFNQSDNLEQLAVEPKYYFEESHPNWEESKDFAYLSKVEYEYLLAQLDTIKPKGALIKPAPDISVATNMTAWHTEIYEHASLTWGEVVDLRGGDNAPYEVKWLRLNYGKQKSS